MRLQPLSWVALTLYLSSAPSADGPAPGFAVETLAFSPPVFGVSATFANGDVLAFDGLVMERVASDGTPVQVYTTLPALAFPSFAVIAPDESFAVVGESSNGVVFEVDVATGAVNPLATLPFNYDAVIAPSGAIYVSAARSAGVNDLVLVDRDGSVEHLAQVPGFSGPIDLDPAGNLYLGVADAPNRVVRFTPAQLAGGVLLSDTDGLLVTTGWSGISYLAVDPETESLFVVENDFVNFTEPPTVYRALSGRSISQPVLTAASTSFSFGKLELGTDTGHPAVFRAFQPDAGGRLTVPVTDFGAFAAQRVSVRPKRPTAHVSGPGVGPGNSGLVVYTVEGAYPGGALLLGFGAAATFDPLETAHDIHPDVPPIFWGLDVKKDKFLQLRLAADQDGKASFAVFNPGFFGGFIAFQSGLTDDVLEIVGSAPGVVL